MFICWLNVILNLAFIVWYVCLKAVLLGCYVKSFRSWYVNCRHCGPIRTLSVLLLLPSVCLPIILKRQGKSKMKSPVFLSDVQKAEMVEMYKDGASIRACARQFQVDTST